ncbi:replication-relaxation family protein [Natroniella sulfidigena]|uniref:replication-relaxation family protein n=1 Tax=Natroniella sulfidigena TaxID=723921 RepID=UPI00200B82D3|nr:replication-relaxation family protein [Natroniella sulfidigena]
MLTDRDKQVIVSVGKHKALSQPQIERLHFKSYATCQRRFRRELVKNDYLSQPFYWPYGKWNRLALYRLESEGKKIYKEITGRDYRQPAWSENYIPHLLETNRIILELYSLVDDLWLEYRPAREAKTQLDALLQLTNGNKLILEVDLASETKRQLQNQFRNYQNELENYNLPANIVFFSGRSNKLYNWCLEVADKSLDVNPVFVGLNKVKQLKEQLRRGKI